LCVRACAKNAALLIAVVNVVAVERYCASTLEQEEPLCPANTSEHSDSHSHDAPCSARWPVGCCCAEACLIITCTTVLQSHSPPQPRPEQTRHPGSSLTRHCVLASSRLGSPRLGGLVCFPASSEVLFTSCHALQFNRSASQPAHHSSTRARLADAGGFSTALKEADRGTACTREEGGLRAHLFPCMHALLLQPHCTAAHPLA